MSQQYPDDEEKPLFLSYWDRLPVELHDMIFEFTDVLTRFLNDRIKKLEDKTNHSIWLHAMSTNWPGDFSLLPDPPTDGQYSVTNDDLALVSSCDLYDKLCQRLPDAAESNPMFAGIDKQISDSQNNYRIPQKTLNNIHKLRLLHIPMRNLWLDLLQKWIDENPYVLAYHCVYLNHHDLLLHLIGLDKVDVTEIQYFKFLGRNSVFSCNAMNYLCRFCDLDMLKMFHDAGCRTISDLAYSHAVENGHLDVLIWLHDNYPQYFDDSMVLLEAEQQGHILVLKWLYELDPEFFDESDWSVPADHGHLSVIQWYHEMGFDGCSECVMDYSASSGHLDIVKWLHENRSEGCTTWAMDNAAKNGHTDVVRFLIENRSEGFTDRAVQMSKTPEIVELLVAKMDVERCRSVLETARSGEWEQFIIEVLEQRAAD